MRTPLLSARKEERIRQKASEENEDDDEEIEDDDNNDNNFVVLREDAKGATRENMTLWFYWYPEERAVFYLSEMEIFFPKK